MTETIACIRKDPHPAHDWRFSLKAHGDLVHCPGVPEPPKLLLLDELVERLDDVRKLAEAGDWDQAHGARDELLLLALSHILHAPLSVERMREVAAAALEVESIEFPRHTA